jgi:uncharacterized membrane protein
MLVSGLVVSTLVATSAAAASAQQATPSPIPLPNAVEITTPFPSVVADKKSTLTFPLTVSNGTPSTQAFDLVISEGPADWNPVVRARGFTVKRVSLGTQKTESMDFQVKPPENVEPRPYNFTIKAVSGGTDLSTLRLTVTMQDKPAAGVKLVTQLPELRGPSKNKFVFKLDLTNEADEDRSIALSATAPQNWLVNIKPSFEDKQISAISLKANENKSLDVEVQPPDKAPAGDYDVKIQASAGESRAETALKVALTGTYEMTLNTDTGRLNAKATSGQTSPFTLVVANTGTAALQRVALSSSKPEGWEVKFEPDTIQQLEPGGQQQVAVSLKPTANAIAGDYSLSVTASNPQASKSVDIRTTVETPTVWGWLGAAIIVLVIAGLYGVFRVYGRR